MVLCVSPEQLATLLQQGCTGDVTLVLSEPSFDFQDMNAFRWRQSPAQLAVVDAWRKAAQTLDATVALPSVNRLVVWAAPAAATGLGALANVHVSAVHVYECESSDRSTVLAACSESLHTLKLFSSHLTVWPDSMSTGELMALKTLDLSGCTSLPEWLGQLTALTTLNLNSCRSLGLPESMGQLTALTTLDLSGCSSLTGCPSRWASWQP